MKNFNLLLYILFTIHYNVNAQNLLPDINIPVTKNGNQLVNPWAGGLNSPQLSTIDLDGDGIKDLVVFDNGRITTYINNGTAGQVDYHYAPEYISAFPEMHAWALFVDYNCDGKEDIFTYGNGGIMVYRNVTLTSGLQFVLQTTQINSMYGTILSNIYCNSMTLPGLADIDGDGDLDILSFAISDETIEFHKNYSIENYGTCDSLTFALDTSSWGGILIMKPNPDNPDGLVSRVNSPKKGNILAIDNDGDGDMDLLTRGGGSFGQYKGRLYYYENTGNSSADRTKILTDFFVIWH